MLEPAVTRAIETKVVEVHPAEPTPAPVDDVPEPCGCDESQAMLSLLESIVEYDEATNPCDPDFCQGECAFCKARALLAGLAEKRRIIHERGHL